MDQKHKILLVFGTRPEAIKMAPLVLRLRECEDFEAVCCVTGQHREMLDAMLEVFSLTPDYDLNIMEPNQTLATITSKTLLGMDRVLQEVRPEMVLVHGDTSTAMASALSSFYRQIPIGHVEAGLRTGDLSSPFPEEMNRVVIDDIAAAAFSPTEANAENLRREGAPGEIFVTGNTVIDAMRYTVRDDYRFSTELLNKLDFLKKKIIVMTCHRRENIGSNMENIFHAVRDTILSHPEAEMVFPVHLSPVVRECAHRILADVPGIHLIDPLDADEMHNLMARCSFVMTDSGGLQEEAPALGKPVLVLRRETERPEAVHAGTVRLTGVEYDAIRADAHTLLTDEQTYNSMARAVNPYGDGRACERIVQALRWYFDRSLPRPKDFCPDNGAEK